MLRRDDGYGHRVYCTHCDYSTSVYETSAEAIAEAQKTHSEQSIEELRRDERALCSLCDRIKLEVE